MATKIRPELHDLLKLVGSSSKHMCPHSYESDLSNTMQSDLWPSLKHHCVAASIEHAKHGLKCAIYPVGKELFCLHYADILASTTSRRLKDIYRSRTTFRIWRDNRIQFQEDVETDVALLRIINSTKDFSGFFEQNLEKFRIRPEDVGSCPFASLYTHSILVKKWYSFLSKNADYFELPDIVQTFEEVQRLVHKIENAKDVKSLY
jgi:hypothetical protein